MKYFILFLPLFLSACSSTPNSKADVNLTETMALIAQTEAKAPEGVSGTFTFLIKASGERRGEVYLNSELDYRDRRSVTIVLTPTLAKMLTSKYGMSPEKYFVDKTIEVEGMAKRAKISFYSRGRMTDKYYFQTHVYVSSPEQIKLIG